MVSRRARLQRERVLDPYAPYVARSTESLQPEDPAAFTQAVESLRAARLRPEIQVSEAPAPKRLAPHAHAMTADVVLPADASGRESAPGADDDDAIATGRLVLLYNPGGHEAWHGEFRLITYVRAHLEPEMGADPLLLGAAWTWLTDALADHAAPYTAASGTVTRSASEGFGGMVSETATAEVEIRASWTPLEPDLTAHALAWGDALIIAAGLVPLPRGVVAIPQPRGRQPR